MEAQITKHNEAIKSKMPDIEKALETIEFLEKKHKEKNANLNVDYMVHNNLWAKATVDVTDRVCLWLGAEVLCEYTFDEANALLTKNKDNANISLKTNVYYSEI